MGVCREHQLRRVLARHVRKSNGQHFSRKAVRFTTRHKLRVDVLQLCVHGARLYYPQAHM